MASTKNIKVVLLGAFTLFLLIWLASGTFSKVFGVSGNRTEALSLVPDNKDGYVGSDSCKDCHEDQFKSFSETKHSKLSQIDSWKDKVQGCESCHGPGKAHLEDATDKTKIISFKNKNSKEISETCLSCHAGKESHNNFRRGEHWRNDVGCTECHTAHGPQLASFKAGSITNPGETTNNNPSSATLAMLKKSEPQLCITCHSEVKSQFSKPNHHKVLEGAMKCSDCHNAHGGFEQKQTRLSVGVDAACIKCHTDKQGPFVFEHAPLKTEGCTACHTPHGSNNPKMLNRSSVRQLCIECHSSITEQLAPDTPSFHNQATVRFQNCTICHAKIHGSNSDSFFFR
ncbi:MAG: DmsE family decaheme c-type cytochrome [Actinomycetota bacterium]